MTRVLKLALAIVIGTTALLAQEKKPDQPTVTPPVTPSETNQDLRKLPPAQPWKPGEPVREVPDLKQSPPETAATSQAVAPLIFNADLHTLPVAPQRPFAKKTRAGSLTVSTDEGTFDIAEGSKSIGRFRFQALWPQGPCSSDGSPLTARHDASANRWLLARWAAPAPNSAFHYCVAISRTADPVRGGWFLYDFRLPMYAASSSLEILPGQYLVVINLGGPQAAFAFERVRMLEGAPATVARTLPARDSPARDH